MPASQKNNLLQEDSGLSAVQEQIRKERARRAALPKKKPSGGRKSFGGFVENVLQDAFDTAKDMAQGILHSIISTPGLVVDLVKEIHRGGWGVVEQPGAFFESLGDSAVKVKDAVIGNYIKYGAEAPYYKPVGTALDALFVAGFLGKGVATVGKVARVERLQTIGNAIQRMPSIVAQKAKKGIYKARGLDYEKHREALFLRAEERKAMEARADEVGRKFYALAKGITKEEKALLDKMLVRGGTLAELEASPRVKAAFEFWKAELEGYREPILIKRGLQTREQLDMARAKKFAADVYGSIDDAAVARALDDIAKLEVKPVYIPAVFQIKGANVEDMLRMPERIRVGKVGFLEAFRSGKGRITDPTKYIPRAISEFHKVEGNLRWADRILENAALATGTIKLGRKAREKAVGEVIPSYGIFQKYWASKERARSVFVRDLVKEKGVEGAARLLIGDKDTIRALRATTNVIVDPAVARILRADFTVYGGTFGAILNVYKAFLRTFRKMGTRWNPRFYVAQVVGDAALVALAGVGLRSSRLAGKLKEFMPPIVTSRPGIMMEMGAPGFGKLQNVGDFFMGADVAARQAILAKHVAEKLKRTAVPFYAIEDEIRKVLKSTTDLSAREIALSQLDQRIAATSPKIAVLNRQMAGIDREINRLAIQAKRASPSKNMELRLKAEELGLEKGKLFEQRQQLAADIRDGMMRRGELEKAIPGLRQDAELVRQGVERANQFIGNYDLLDPIEQHIFRNIVPFYAFNRAMALLAFRLPLLAPGTTFLWSRYAKFMMDMVGDPELPEWVQGYFPFGVRQNGETVWVKLSSFNPLVGMRVTKFGGIPIPSVFDFVEQNPLISLAFRSKGGKTIFDRSSIPYGETIVGVHTGDYYEFMEDGRIREVIPQPPFISSALHMFPSVQLLEQLLLPYKVVEYGSLGLPKPVINPDGTQKYPRELWQNLGVLVGLPPSMVRGREDLIRGEKWRARKVFESFRSAYKRADPDRREYLKQIFEDYKRGQFRRLASD